MKLAHKTLIIVALLGAPLMAAQAAQAATAHEAWIKAQKIDIKPTITVTETQVPLDSASSPGTPGSTSPAGTNGSNTYAPGATTPSYPSNPSGASQPSGSMPDTNSSMPMGSAPVQDNSTTGPGTGIGQPR